MRTHQRPDGSASSSNERGSITGNSNALRAISTRPRPAVAHPDDAVHLQHSVGNAALTRLIGSRVSVQAKLVVGRSDDPYEREADRVADAVTSSTDDSQPVTKDVARASVRAVRPRANGGDGGGTPAPASVERALNSTSTSMSAEVLGDMETRFGQDFSSVRVHTGPTAETATREIAAHAFTVGRDIVVAPSRYSPGSQEGRHLLAHELTHVVQQTGGHATSVIQRQSIDPADYTTFEEWQLNAPAPLSDESVVAAWNGAHPDQPALTLWTRSSEPLTTPSGAHAQPGGASRNPQTLGQGLLTTYESAVRRITYLDRIHQAAEAAVEEVRAARALGDLDRAERAAREASTLRNLIRTETQELLPPGGQAMSEALEQPRDWDSVFKKYGGTRSFDTFERIAESSGRSAKSVTALATFGRYAGPAAIAFGSGVATYEILNASPAERPRVAVREAGGLVGGAVGSTAGTAAGALTAGGIATALGLSGPPGWAVLLIGLGFGVAGGYAGSEIGRSLPEAWMDLEESRRKQLEEMIEGENYLGGFLLSTPQMGTNW